MLGPLKPRHLDPPVVVSLDALVPRDHFYRHLERSLDLGFVRDWVSDAYPSRGRPSIDPVVFFKLYLVMFFEGIRSERQLLALAADRLSVRWYLGYGLDEALPDASGFTRLRQRLGLASSAASLSMWSTFARRRASFGAKRSWPTRPVSPATLPGFPRAQT